VSGQLREASSVILLRRKPAGFEVFLLRRRKGASFMASAFVFPGGGAEGTEDARSAAARELFEEAGILLARDRGDADTETLEMPGMGTLRKKIHDGADAKELLAEIGLEWATDTLVPWSHWITPSIEPKRFSARFFVCELPAGQEPQFDDIETVDQVWVRPADAIMRAKELALPPPQIRTFLDLAGARTVDDALALARRRAEHAHPVMPRLAQTPAGFTLLLPWDPEYESAGQGDLHLMPASHPLATGPTRFVMEDRAWKHVYAPGSTPAAS
jgi:8-oxo-dGTP pyrophosphatase MutT (NUDIX family)